jgi:hypothetical protein
MLKFHGIIGILLVLFVELNFFWEIQPFALWYIPIVWWGYILIIDALIFQKKKKSPLINRPKKVLKWVFLSEVFWILFELLNLFALNWTYYRYTLIVHLVDYTIVFTAIWITYYFLREYKFFDKIRISFNLKFNKSLLVMSILFGLFCMWGPLISPYYLFWGMWVFPILLFDPINYLSGRPSIIRELEKGKLNKIISITIAVLICGFLWEFWNYWAYPKWFYNVPILHDLAIFTPITTFKIFEMYAIGYLGYIPFGLSLFSMYYLAAGILGKFKPS